MLWTEGWKGSSNVDDRLEGREWVMVWLFGFGWSAEDVGGGSEVGGQTRGSGFSQSFCPWDPGTAWCLEIERAWCFISPGFYQKSGGHRSHQVTGIFLVSRWLVWYYIIFVVGNKVYGTRTTLSHWGGENVYLSMCSRYNIHIGFIHSQLEHRHRKEEGKIRYEGAHGGRLSISKVHPGLPKS